MDVKAILFDKDGTLFDFDATWAAWAERAIAHLGVGDGAQEHAVAEALDFDRGAGRFRRESIFIAGTLEESARAVLTAGPDRSLADLVITLRDLADGIPQVEPTPLGPFVAELARRGLSLGVVTNDAEETAHVQLEKAGVLSAFQVVLGYDSGFGAKPDPDPILAALDQMGLPPSAAVMVGDSTHDLHAGRAAGVKTVGVLTGPATKEDLAPYADVVLPQIGALPSWLGDA